MNRTKVNFTVDTVIFFVFVLLVATGLLIRYVLPEGSGRFFTQFGLTRHDWGAVHFWLGLAMITGVAVHLAMHWRWIVAVVKGCRKDSAVRRRTAAAVGALAVAAAILAAPFVVPVERVADETGRRAHQEHAPADVAAQISGSMTLGEVEELTGVPRETILAKLGLPEDTGADSRLGRLVRQHGIEVDAVRATVRRHLARQ